MARKYANDPLVTVDSCMDEKGVKLARIHSPRQPARLLFTRGLEAALLCGSYHLALEIAEAYQLRGEDDGTILRFLVLGNDEQATEHAKIAENWVTGEKDGDWPYPRGQFPKGILQSDDELIADGISQASRAFTSRWKLPRYQTPAMVKRMKTKENAYQKAKEFLIDKGWLLYSHGIAYSVVAAHRGIRGFLSNKDAFSEWIPRELIISGAD